MTVERDTHTQTTALKLLGMLMVFLLLGQGLYFETTALANL
jgi:hypothetical protein